MFRKLRENGSNVMVENKLSRMLIRIAVNKQNLRTGLLLSFQRSGKGAVSLRGTEPNDFFNLKS